MITPDPPSSAQWPPSAGSEQPKSNDRVIFGLALIGFIALAALILGIIDAFGATSNRPDGGPEAPPASSSYPSDQIARAKQDLCAVYEVASRSVKEETNGDDRAMANISLTNAAAMLDAASNNPALESSERDAARTLASAYRTAVAVGSVFEKTSTVGGDALNAANRADSAMASVCS